MYYLQKNTTQANACRAKIASVGNTIADVDIQAQRFGQDKKWPNSVLLYVHLLIDGGYHQMAIDKLGAYNEADFPDVIDKVEYNFRLARAYDEMNNDNKAIQLYQHTINIGKGRKEHFAARSALQMALIYERVGMKQEAIKRFNEALSMRNHDFQGAIDQQAKAGLNRLGASS
ncbi:MAG TPA: tetratricopeptide repeat protein, partial [Flavipsychrobacter sp.]|nr:tetratricopeptide repeat protein [Flavipsychrobacter sp.]